MPRVAATGGSGNLGLTANAATFANNITCTYNVFSAARPAGIRNVARASGETVLGLPFDTPPPDRPAGEEYPARPAAPGTDHARR